MNRTTATLQNKKSTTPAVSNPLLRAAVRPAPAHDMPARIHPGSHFGHDFSRVPARRGPTTEPVTTGDLAGVEEPLELLNEEGEEEKAESPLLPEEEEETAESAPASAAEEADPTAAAAPAAPPRTFIRGPREMWHFDGETPANYLVSTTLSTNKPGGAFNWSTSPQLTLSSPTDARPTVTTAQASTVQRDAWIRVRHTDPAGNATTASYRLTVLQPTRLRHLNDVDAADATWGYDCQIHYEIQDQFNTVLPRNVPINEQWTGGVVADFAGMDWRRGAEGSATVNPANWFDHIQGELAGHTPAPVNPGHADAAVAVYHWPGDWRVGSLTIGSGSRVASVTWQKNRGFARHT